MDRINKRNIINFVKGIIFINLFIIIVFFGVSSNLINCQHRLLEHIDLGKIWVPLANVELDNRQAGSLLREASYCLAGIDQSLERDKAYWNLKVPVALISSHIQALAYSDNISVASPKMLADEELEEFDYEDPPVISRGLPDAKHKKIVFYCTHTAETYIPDSGVARLDHQRGLITDVAKNMANILARQGLNTEFLDIIHDSPDYNKSYTNSRKTVNNIIDKDKDNLAALFDVHRDSILGEKRGETTLQKGKKAAKILIIVGTNERKDHPHWKENLAFAEKIYAQGEKMYPGLIKGVRTKAGTYNQEFFSRSLLLEIGTDRNSFKEAQYAAQLFSNVLIELLK